jgi:hypothetical protein
MSVSCVDDKFTQEQIVLIPNRPVKGDTYTISDVLLTRNGTGLILEELNNPPLPHPNIDGTFIPSFASHRFKIISEVPLEVLSEELQETF